MTISKVQSRVIFIVMLLVTYGFRLYGTNWDQGFHLHPDERMLVMVTERIDFFKELDPDFFNYGSLPIYILAGIAQGLDWGLGTRIDNYDGLLYLGRMISTLMDMGVLVIVGLLALLLFEKRNRAITLASMGTYSLLFFPIQNSNFFIVDTFLTFLLTLLLWILLKLLCKPSLKLVAVLGMVYGAALATKVTPIIYSPAIIGIMAWEIKKRGGFRFVGWFGWIKRVLLFVTAGVGFFSLTMPYALINWQRFIADVSLQLKMNADAYIFPYTLQYVGTIPYFYYLKQIFWWGAGPVSSILALIGMGILVNKLIFSTIKQWSKHDWSIALTLIFYLFYFGVVGQSAVKFMRYMLPLYPAIALLAGYGLVAIYYRIMPFSLRKIAMVGITMVLLLWTVGFLDIYSKPHTRVEASRWILEQIPPGSVIATEHWDDRLPLMGAERYRYESLELYNLPDDDKKWRVIEAQLERSDYLVLASNRLYMPLQRLNDCDRYDKCYPKTADYYRRLFAGELDYEPVAEFQRYPKILGMDLIDNGADESFTVYDHPQVMIYKRKM